MLIIYAHPNKKGHCGYILKEITRKLSEDNKKYNILDLYEMGFDPVLKPDEHYTSGNKNITKENENIQKNILNNCKLIIIYPTWWNSPPAILKGFFDRIFTPKFAFKYISIKFLGKQPFGLLKGRAVVFTTTAGPTLFEILVAKSRSLKIVVNDTLRFCGIKTKGYLIGGATKLTQKQKDKIDLRINKALKFIEK